MASAAWCSLAVEVRTSTRTWGSIRLIRRVAAMPSSFGMATSIRMTSGLTEAAKSTASSPLFASPTISTFSPLNNAPSACRIS